MGAEAISAPFLRWGFCRRHLEKFFESLDANTIIPAKTDYSYDIIR